MGVLMRRAVLAALAPPLWIAPALADVPLLWRLGRAIARLATRVYAGMLIEAARTTPHALDTLREPLATLAGHPALCPALRTKARALLDGEAA